MATRTLIGVDRHDPAAAGERIAAIGAIFAALCAALPLLGWAIGVAELRRFAPAAKDLWPLSATGYLALSAGLIAILAKQCWVARALLAVPLVIGAVTLVEHVTGRPVGLDLLLFPGEVTQIPAQMPGRPSVITGISFLVLAGAMTLSTAGLRRAGWAIAIAASICLALAVLSIALMALRSTGGTGIGLSVAPLPAALATAALATGLLAWRGETGWPGLLALSREDRALYAIAFPLVVLLPTGTTVAGLALIRHAGLQPTDAAAIATAIHVLAFAGLLFWTMGRVVRDRSALAEITRALDSASIAITDAAGRITHWSRGCEELFGYSAPEAIGAFKQDLLQSQQAPRSIEAPTPFADETIGEWIEKRRDGSSVHVLERRRRLHFYGREPIFVLRMTDISDRIAMEEELRLSRARLEMAVEAHEVGIFEWDVASGALTWSPGSEQRLGLTLGSLSSYDRWAALVDPYDVKSIETTIAEAIARREPRFTFYYRFRQPNGHIRAIEGSCRCIYDEAGTFVRAVGVMIDVTRRDDREAVLQSSEAQLRSVLETVPDAMIVVDEAGRIQSFSRAAEELLGYRGDDMVARDFSLIVPGGVAAHEVGYRRLFAEGDKHRKGVGRVVQAHHASGEEIPVELRLGSTRVGGQRMFTAFLRDLRARIESEKRLNRLRDDLAHVGRLSAMGELAAGLAHELNQPLSASVNFLATADMLLQANAGTEQVSEMIQMASSQNKRAGEIIRRLRAFLSRHEPEVSAQPVDETVREAVALVLVGHSRLDVQVEFDLDPAARLMFADRVQVQQVLVNLVRNAAEVMSASGGVQRIEIGSRAIEDDLLEIWVRDHGPGIPPHILEQMFTPFQSTKGSGGMGIGLTICRRIVEAHGGELVAENMPDGGARFRFTLPKITEEELGEA